LVEKLERIELPSQTLSVLQDPLLQKYLALRPSDDAFERLNFWLAAFFEEEIDNMRKGNDPSTALSEILTGLESFLVSTQVGFT